MALTRSVVQDLGARHAGASQVTVDAPADLPTVAVDPARVRLLIRNLLDNALRHGAGAEQAPVVRLVGGRTEGPHRGARPTGPVCPRTRSNSWRRRSTARTVRAHRSAGGVGLGLYLCRLVAKAHGGSFEVRNAQPGLQVTVTLPLV